MEMDESGFLTVLSKMGKVIAIKGMKHIGQATSVELGAMIIWFGMYAGSIDEFKFSQ